MFGGFSNTCILLVQEEGIQNGTLINWIRKDLVGSAQVEWTKMGRRSDRKQHKGWPEWRFKQFNQTDIKEQRI